MTDSDLTVSILREIRDAVVAVNQNLSARIDGVSTRLDSVSSRLDGVSSRIDTLTEHLDQRFGVVETTLKDLSGQLVLVTRYLKHRTEVDIEDLRQRVTRLEAKVG